MSDLIIHLVSGGSGMTGGQVLRACLAQFPDRDVRIRSSCSVASVAEAEALAREAADQGAILCHTLVDPEVRQALAHAALALSVPCIDLLGPALAIIGERLSQSPAGRAGLLYELHREQFDRMDAVDFTMAHDDGQRLHELEQADVVLVGLSRVSKSVTCFYLASRGIRAANVPLVTGWSTPAELLSLDPQKVIGLTMNASHLAAVRRARLERIGGKREIPEYTDLRSLNRELYAVESLIAQQNWLRIDVSYKATEEVASEIMDHLFQRAAA